MNQYYLNLYHSGLGHDDNPPGRGSGRYPWGSGKRPYQTLKKGTRISRLSLKETDYNYENNRRYVTVGDRTEGGITIPDEFYLENTNPTIPIYEKLYETVKDIRVSDTENNKKIFSDWLKENPEEKMFNIPMRIEDWEIKTGLNRTGDLTEDFFNQLQSDNPTNKEFFNYMKARGYDAMVDNFGYAAGRKKNIIILDPNNSLRIISQKVTQSKNPYS